MILEVVDLKKHFPIRKGLFRKTVDHHRAVDGVSFSVSKGEIVGLVGESGSGKSTTARSVMRLIEPTSGDIRFLGEDFRALSAKRLRQRRQKIQIVFQDPYSSLNPRKTIRQNIGEVLMVHGIVRTVDERDQRVAKVIELVGLSPAVLDRYPHQFSGGQQQRICIARALILEPELIVCDEAVSALDLSVQAQILNLLSDLRRDLGLALLFISHDLSVVRYLCDRVLVMHQGVVVEEGPCGALFESPNHPYTKKLLNSILKADLSAR